MNPIFAPRLSVASSSVDGGIDPEQPSSSAGAAVGVQRMPEDEVYYTRLILESNQDKGSELAELRTNNVRPSRTMEELLHNSQSATPASQPPPRGNPSVPRTAHFHSTFNFAAGTSTPI